MQELEQESTEKRSRCLHQRTNAGQQHQTSHKEHNTPTHTIIHKPFTHEGPCIVGPQAHGHCLQQHTTEIGTDDLSIPVKRSMLQKDNFRYPQEENGQ